MYMHQYNEEFSVHVHVSQTFRPSNVVRRLKLKSNTCGLQGIHVHLPDFDSSLTYHVGKVLSS